MFRLFRNLKPMALLLVIVVLLVTGQAVAELYLPEKMSEIIDNGIYLDYEPLYEHLTMPKPDVIGDITDSDTTVSGYDEDTIPVFEMVDGFSTYDLNEALNVADPTLTYKLLFVDIPVKDSRELFDEIITPFMDGLEKYQRVDANFDKDYTEAEQKEIEAIINTLIYFNMNNAVSPSLPISGNSISVNSLLDKDEDDDAMSNDNFRKILTACIISMKHSENGNLMPIPLDSNGNRLATDEYGQAIDGSKLIYMYEDDSGETVYDAADSETGRPSPMPDYELVICAKVLGYSYKYENGDKWVTHRLGITDGTAQINANNFNGSLLKSLLLTSDKFTSEEIETLGSKINKIVKTKYYQDNLIVLDKLLNASGSSAKRITKLINRYAETDPSALEELPWYNTERSKWKAEEFFIKLGNYLTLSETGTNQAKHDNELKTAKEMKLADGDTIQASDFTYILTRGGLMLLLTVASCICAIIAAYISSKIAADFSATIRSQVFGKVETFSLREFDKFSTASLITRSTNDINQIQTVFLLILRTALIAPITVIGGFIMSGQKSPPMTITILYAFPILIVASVVASKVVFPLFALIQTKVDRLTLIMREGVTGIRVVRAFNQQPRERDRFQEVNKSVTKTAITVNQYCAILAPLITVVMNCVLIGIVWVASKQIAYDGYFWLFGVHTPAFEFYNDINVGDMMAVMQYITQIMLALVMLATVFVMFPRASASALRINQVLDTELTILDPETADKNYTAVGSVEFKHVNFKFSDEAENWILNDINFRAEKGKVTAIVGGTGSGKSAVINLIPRFYDIQEGEILIDGVPIKDIPQEELRDKIGFVPQRSMLFSGTIRSNLQYGKQNATEEDFWEALTVAQSDTFVKEKENGLDSKVEQGGNNFSGGQKQRLAIARALIRKPEVLIFDDSFSALDFRTDKNLRAALKPMTTESATIIVAQRIGTIMDADNILVLGDGKIVGQGTHEYLVHNCELYRDIALSQMSEEELGL